MNFPKFNNNNAVKPITPREVDSQNMQNMQNSNPQAFNQIQAMDNPFNNPAFQNQLPDIPIQENGAAMINALLSDETVPAEIRKEFWFVFHRDNVLTFLDKERKYAKLLSFDILKIDCLNNTPYYDYTFEKEMKWNAARQMFEVKLDRALGNDKGQNERLVIPLSVSENITRVENMDGGNQKEGFLKRILSRN